MMLTEYNQMHMLMMAMVTMVAPLVVEVSEVEVVVVSMEEDVVKLFVITVISHDIMQEIVTIPL